MFFKHQFISLMFALDVLLALLCFVVAFLDRSSAKQSMVIGTLWTLNAIALWMAK